MARDPMSPPFHVNLCYGLRFVQLSILVSPTKTAGPARALPVRFDLAPPVLKPKKNAPAELWDSYREEKKQRTLSHAGIAAISSLRQSLNQNSQTCHRQLILTGDASYTNRTVLRHLSARTTYIGRIRKDAKLHYYQPKAEGKENRYGRPRLYGPQAPSPQQILQDPTIPLRRIRCFAAGKLRLIPVKVLAQPLQWRKAGPDLPLQVVVIKPLGYRLRKGGKLLYRQPAFLICSDPNLDLHTLVQSYLYRWEIECNHRDEKSLLGVAQGQVRNPLAVSRLPQLQVAAYSLLLLASLLSSGFQRTAAYFPLPKWRRKAIRPSLLDLLILLRHQIFARATHLSPLLDFDHFLTSNYLPKKSQKPPTPAELLATCAA